MKPSPSLPEKGTEDIKQGQVFAVVGIDTDIGKTVATGLIARSLRQAGRRVITQKLVQTGCLGRSDDIVTHRRIMGLAFGREDELGLTCPYVLPTPCSPHLAARLAGTAIDPERIRQATAELRRLYQIVLVEGAGGLFVPLTEDFTLLDYLSGEGYPLILVTSTRLGSINHSLSALEAIQHRQLTLAGVVYNRQPTADERIAEDSRRVIGHYLQRYGFYCPLVDLHPLADYENGLDLVPLRQFFFSPGTNVQALPIDDTFKEQG